MQVSKWQSMVNKMNENQKEEVCVNAEAHIGREKSYSKPVSEILEEWDEFMSKQRVRGTGGYGLMKYAEQYEVEEKAKPEVR